MLDTLDYARRLESAGFTREQAEGAAEALAAALSERVASKDDLRAAVAELRHELELGLAGLRREFEVLRREMEVLKRDLVIRLGAIVIATVAAATAVDRLLG